MATGTRPSAGIPPATPPAPERPPGGWTAGRIAAVVAGAVLALVSLGLLGGGATMMWADQAMRDDGYLTAGTSTYSTSGYALASQPLELGWGWLVTGLIGDIRVRVTPVNSGQPVLVAIGPADKVTAYLSGVSYATVPNPGQNGLVSHYGTVIPAPPRTARIWTAQVSGTGTQTLRWVPRPAPG